jgi:7-cyano-7-deazaguanine synthase
MGFQIYAMSFCYGQRHQTELRCARRLADAWSVARQIVVDIDLAQFGGSALTVGRVVEAVHASSTDMAVPKGRSESAMAAEIPITYVPARNTVFLSLALAWAETLVARDIFIGVNALDYSGYPDCRPEFIAQFQRLAQLATKSGIEENEPWIIHAPLIQMTKQQIIEKGITLGVDYGMTFSCYDPVEEEVACGQCDACQLRLRGFAQAGVRDPCRYVAQVARRVYNRDMSGGQQNDYFREQGIFVFERMFGAVEKVRERLERACRALENAGILYAVIGGNAVAAWVATQDDGAVRNTRDVDLLLREEDLEQATHAMRLANFHRDQVMDVTVFLDGPEGKPSQGVHILFAGKKVKEGYVSATPQIHRVVTIDNKRIIELVDLVEMKLNSYRDRDRTHLRDMIGVGLIDRTWPQRFDSILGQRLQMLLDDPEG